MALKRTLYSLLGLSLLTPGFVHGAEPEWPAETLSIHVQEEPLPEFLHDFFAAIDMKVLVSPSVAGNISGRFDAAPEQIFSDVVKAYGLLPYFDGAVTHVSMATDVRSQVYTLRPRELDRVLKSIIAQDLADRYQSVHVVRDENLVKVRGAPEFILDVDKIVERTRPARARPLEFTQQVQLPEPAGGEMVFRTFALQYASAADVTLNQGGREFTIPGVASILRSMVGDGRSPTTTSIYFGPSGLKTVPGLRDRRTPAATDPAVVPSEVPTTGGVITDRPFVTRIEAERNLNAIIVRDYADAMPIYEQLVRQLDVEPMLIEIQVTIIDVDKSKLEDLGVDWQYAGNRNQARFGGAQVIDQDGGLLLNTVLGDLERFSARVNALAVQGSADIVSRPQVLTLSNLEAVLASDQSFFVRVAGNEDVDLFNVTVGTTLRVVPNVVGAEDDPQIRLLVSIEDGSLTPEAVDDIPIVDKSTLSTQAIIYDGESLLLGGLVRNTKSSDVSKVPLLGDVPLLGRVFKRTVDITTSTERLFLITPKVVTGTRGSAQSTGYERRTVRYNGRREVDAYAPEPYLDGF